MKKTQAPAPAKTRIFKLEPQQRGTKFKRGKVSIIKADRREPKWGWLSLLLSLALCLAVVPAAIFLLGDDSSYFFRWLLGSFLMGLAVYPLALQMFMRHRGLAWIFSLPLGLSLVSFTVWTLAYLRLLPFTQTSVAIVTLIWALLAYLNPKTAKAAAISLFKKAQWRALFLSLASFALALLAMSFVRGLMPAARGLEKFMDYGIMNLLWRSEFLPAADMWFAGHSINYYYYGQYAYTLVAKLTGLRPEYAYNLSMASSFSYMLTMAYGIGYLLITLSSRRRKLSRGLKTGLRTLGGFGAAVFTCFAGNSHDFFISPLAPAKALLNWLAQGSARFGNLDSYYFPDATRYIGYNPDTLDKTIHEFPFYSFLVGDLHAHLVNTVFVLLFIATVLLILESKPLLAYFRLLRSQRLFLSLKNDQHRPRFEGNSSLSRPRWILLIHFFKAWFSSGLLPLATLLLGIFMMGNFWDFPIYWVFMALFLVYACKRALGPQAHWLTLPLGFLQLAAVFLPFLFVADTISQSGYFLAAMLFAVFIFILRPSLWTSIGLSLNLSFSLAHLLIIPFNLHFSPMAKEIAIVPYHSPIFQLFILYGPQALIFLLFATTLLLLALLRSKKAAKTAAEAAADAGQSNSRPIERPALQKAAGSQDRERIWLNRRSLLPQNYKMEVDKHVEKESYKRAHTRYRRSFCRRFHPGSVVVLLLLSCAFGLILAPEFIYVRDIYENGFARANTMFKFTYQASLILGLSLPAAAITLLVEWLHQNRLNRLALAQEQVQPSSIQMDKTAGVPINIQLSSYAVLAQEKAELNRVIGLRTRRLSTWPLAFVFILVLLLLSAPLIYPFAATPGWLPPLKLENYKGLNASAWMENSTSPQIAAELGGGTLKNDLDVIDWFNSEVSGQPVIVEANGLSYTDSARISAYTGLPTILGWQTHEWLWRTTADGENAYAALVAPREGDVKTIYETRSDVELISLLRIYDVSYIIIGDIERSTYPELNEDLLSGVGTVVFESGRTRVIRVA